MDIEKRLHRLEWTNRFMFALLILLTGYIAVGFVQAAASPGKIVADSIATHALHVINSYGKQSFDVEIGDSGMVGAGLNDANGKSRISLLTEADGSPSICVTDGHICRIVIGNVFRNGKQELSIQLRDKNGHTIWMPDVTNPYIPPHSVCANDYLAQHPDFKGFCKEKN